MALYPEQGPTKPLDRRPQGTLRKVRARAMIFMVIALSAGLSAAWLVTRYVARHSASATVVPLTNVVVAAVDLPLATTLKPEMLKIVEWPASAQPQGSFGDLSSLEGRVTGVALVAGEPVVEVRLSAKGSGAGMAALIPRDMRAMTVPVNEIIGVGGFIHPGDLVDVITTMQAPLARTGNGGQEHTQEQEYRSKIVLQNIRVLAVGEQLVAENNKPEKVPAVTLLVSPEESERLALASTQGKLQLTMRSQMDNGELPTPGVSPPELLALAKDAATPAAPAAPLEPFNHHHYVLRPATTRIAMTTPPPPPPAGVVEVVEILRGDRVEERKMPVKGGQ